MGDLEDFQGKAKKAPADAAMEKGGRDPEAGKAAAAAGKTISARRARKPQKQNAARGLP